MLNYTLYQTKKNAPWVTFIHGAGGSSSIWFKQIRRFSKYFNLLLIDLRGHGASKTKLHLSNEELYTFDAIAQDVVEVLDHEKIEKSHFIGISLGTILIRQIAEMQPQKVISMTMGGAVLKLNIRSRILMHLGNLIKSVVPYMWIYKVFAFIMMPNRNHKESRNVFIREAKKLYQKEFIRWFKLTGEVIPLLKFFRQEESNIPTLYVMGSEDYMFLPVVKEVVLQHQSSKLKVIPNCGHVVNVERANQFNDLTINFLKAQ
ncbi:MAG: alpha/beta fold hydrolase [Flavobacteriaceae bacterium]